LFLTESLTQHNLEQIETNNGGRQSEFMKAYLDKGRISGLLEDIPLFAVKLKGKEGKDSVGLGLRGACDQAKEVWWNEKEGTDRIKKRKCFS
jgi:glucokinase